jgi:hypothetical protein
MRTGNVGQIFIYLLNDKLEIKIIFYLVNED